MSEERKVAAPSNLLTKAHQWVTLVGIPLGLSIVAWIAVTFDTMRFDVHDLKQEVGFMSQDIGKHTTELRQISKVLGLDQ
jgi:hypothetical protein